jgi:mediator of RNA polymerase II transcription subunit 5
MVGCQMQGSKLILRVILEEIRQDSKAGSASIVYDIASAIICAPNVLMDPAPGTNMMDEHGNVAPPVQCRITLREALRMEAEDCFKIQKTDPGLAEIVVRLHRRVEALMVMPQPQAMLQEADMSLSLAVAGDAGTLGDAMGSTTDGQDEVMAVDGVGLDLGMAGVGGDLGLGGPSGSGSLDGGGDVDLYGLGGNMDMFDNWDTMDMS